MPLGSEHSWYVTFDRDADALVTVARRIIGELGDQKKILLVKTPFSYIEYAPWLELIGSVIEHQRIGRYVDLKTARELLGGVEDIKLLETDPSSQAGNLVIKLREAPCTYADINSMRERLSIWGEELETHAGPEYSPSFSSLSGGSRPLVVVLDDYNNYISIKNGLYCPADDVCLIDYAPLYFQQENIDIAVNLFQECLSGFCSTLNNLSAAFEVHCPRLWVKAAGYEEVAAALRGDWFEQRRDRIAAFLVDLEWKPTLPTKQLSGNDEEWASMGHRAIHLLSSRFPEIPCFVFAGGHPYRKLQDALSHGSLWCFTKGKTHHGYEVKEPEPLTALALEQHLANGARVRYGSFHDLPFPEQLKVDSSASPARKLAEKLGLSFPLERCPIGRNLQSVIARLYPNGAQVWPVRVLDGSRSKAQATFFVAAERGGHQLATRFIKVGPWFEIQREYLAYRRVIEPRLNSHIASVIGKPVVSLTHTEGAAQMAGLVYSLAGFPENFDSLFSLDDLIARDQEESDQGNLVGQSIHQTLERVLKPLYTCIEHGETVKLKSIQQPLWCWLGDVLPPVFTGVLPPLGWKIKETQKRLVSYIDQGYKETSAWILAACDCRDLPRAKKLSPWDLEGSPVELQGFQLLEVEWEPDELGIGEITLRHPDLGFRIRLRGRAGDIRRRFGAIWMRPGMPVNVTALLDEENREVDKINSAVHAGLNALGVSYESTFSWLKEAFPTSSDEWVPDPGEVFSSQGLLPLHYTITARQGPIHGDLNPRNILLAEYGATGWLIDFERAVEQGMTAFDLAKLEVEIWHHHFFPILESIAKGQPEGGLILVELQAAALAAIDAGSNAGEVFETRIRKEPMPHASARLLDNAKKLLGHIDLIRRFAREILDKSQDDLHWALSAYFFVSVKFAKKHPERAALMFAASAWHLRKVCPKIDVEFPSCISELTEKLCQPACERPPRSVIDGLLVAMQQRKSKDTVALTVDMAKPKEGHCIEWRKDGPGERWDLASTGGVANITPIMGYLWLMAKAEQSKKGSRFDVIVPKISSRGASCGTVDILESGGLRFPSEPAAIVDACCRNGGILCRQNPEQTPADTELMARRKKINLMKDIGLMTASILSKKIAMGCTHTIIDVKVGRDSKVIAPWMENEDISAFVTDVPSGKMFPNVAERFKRLLENELAFDSGKITVEKSNACMWLKQSPRWSSSDEGNPALNEIRWFFTNSSMPQCRAIGRQLILLHLDDLILGTYGDDLLDDGKDNAYKTLYREFLPEICGFKGEGHSWKKLQAQWRLLKKQLPQWDLFLIEPLFVELKETREGRSGNDGRASEARRDIVLLAQNNFEKGLMLAENVDLRVMTLALGSYQPSARAGITVQHIDAWMLDSFFDWLCGEDSFDPEVGIYLHCLPGENVEAPHEKPFITVCYRPARCPESDVLQKIRCFLSEGVEVGMAS